MDVSPPSPNTAALLWALGILQTLVSGLAVAIWKDVKSHGRELLALRIVLTGEKGNNGVKGDVTALKKSKHRIDNNINALAWALAATRLESNLDEMDLKLRAEGQ